MSEIHKRRWHFPGHGKAGFVVKSCDGQPISMALGAHYWNEVTCEQCLKRRPASKFAHLEREREEDQKAIRGAKATLNDGFLFDLWCQKFAAAIARATGQEGAK